MRVAALLFGLEAYRDTCYREFARLGNDLLLVHPETLSYAPFDRSGLSTEVERLLWSAETMPSGDELNQRLEAFQPDVIIMSSWSGRGYRAVMKQWRGRALRVMFSSNYWWGTMRQRVGTIVHPVYVNPLFDCAWVPCERSELFVRQLGFARKDIIRGGNSADTPLFDRGPRDGAELAGRRRFVFTGRLIWHKGPELLAEAYREYRNRVDAPWELVVAGDGPLRTAFDGIEGVDARGFVQPADLTDLLHESSCLILPSHIEWYGVVVHEAAAAGLPVIVGDGVGAASHLVQDAANGWIVATDVRDELVDAMVRMSSAAPERLQSMSDTSRALASRMNPTIWAQNLQEQLERRVQALRG